MKVKQKTDRQKADLGRQNKENTRTFTKARENKRQRGKPLCALEFWEIQIFKNYFSYLKIYYLFSPS